MFYKLFIIKKIYLVYTANNILILFKDSNEINRSTNTRYKKPTVSRK